MFYIWLYVGHILKCVVMIFLLFWSGLYNKCHSVKLGSFMACVRYIRLAFLLYRQNVISFALSQSP